MATYVWKGRSMAGEAQSGEIEVGRQEEALELLRKKRILVTSLRPSADAQTTGWWRIFTNPTLTLENYSQVISGGAVIPNGIAPYFFNSFAIAIPAGILAGLVR